MTEKASRRECAHCGYHIREGETACSFCGKAVMTGEGGKKKCPHCFSDIDARARVCPNCAKALRGYGADGRGHDPLMIFGALFAGVGLAVLIGIPIMVPGGNSPGWAFWAIVVGGIMLLIGYFR